MVGRVGGKAALPCQYSPREVMFTPRSKTSLLAWSTILRSCDTDSGEKVQNGSELEVERSVSFDGLQPCKANEKYQGTRKERMRFVKQDGKSRAVYTKVVDVASGTMKY